MVAVTVATTATPATAAGVVAASRAFTCAVNEPLVRTVAAVFEATAVAAVAIASLPLSTLETRPVPVALMVRAVAAAEAAEPSKVEA